MHPHPQQPQRSRRVIQPRDGRTHQAWGCGGGQGCCGVGDAQPHWGAESGRGCMAVPGGLAGIHLQSVWSSGAQVPHTDWRGAGIG